MRRAPLDLSLWRQSRKEIGRDMKQEAGGRRRASSPAPSVLAPGTALRLLPSRAVSSARVEEIPNAGWSGWQEPELRCSQTSGRRTIKMI